MLQRVEKVLVGEFCFFVAQRAELGLVAEAGPLLHGVVQLAEGVGDLHAAYKALKALHQARVRATGRIGMKGHLQDELLIFKNTRP